jgi:dTDP-4-dehydrorhamnose 3,5-epimerase
MTMAQPMIEGVMVKPLRRIPDERGAIYHMVKVTDPDFKQFGEIYFSVVNPGAIKGWHVHKAMTLNYAVVKGMIKLVLYDARVKSPTKGMLQEIFMGDDNYVLVTVPPGVVNGFKGIGVEQSIVANCASHPHDPDEIERIDPFNKKIGYDWGIKHG